MLGSFPDMSKGTTVQVSPSILAADMGNLEREIDAAWEAGADRFHLDVMDGHFAPNLSMGPWMVKCVRRLTPLPLDVQLMIKNPVDHLEAFLEAGADMIFIHLESENCRRALEMIPSSKAGVALNPETPLPSVGKFSESVLIMTVNPGFCGQKFMNNQLDKISQAKKEGFKMIQVDGGVNRETAALARDAGANVLIAGSAIYGSSGYRKEIEAIRGP